MQEFLIPAVLGSPVILAVINWILSIRPNKESLKKIEEMSVNFKKHQVETAVIQLRQKNWRLISTRSTRQYSSTEYFMLKNNLERLIPYDEWPISLKEECILAENIIRGENNEK